MTPSAAEFVPPKTVSLFADEVIADGDPDLRFETNHVALAAQAGLVMVLPATAHIMSVVAHGQAPGLLPLVVMAARCDVLFVPSMNRVMWARPAVQRNVAQLRDDGYEVVDPEWLPRFEAATRKFAENPSAPSPKRIAALVAARMQGTGVRREERS
jgi:phosphopantothenoylcysteine synthetase/decarboxylase